MLFRTGGEAKASVPVPSDETLHIRQLENGLERPCGRSRPASRHLASLVVADAFAGELTRGSFKTISATEETTNTQRFEANSLADGTVNGEPVSGSKFPASREFAGNFSEFEPDQAKGV